EEGLGRVLDGGLEPDVPVVLEPVPHEVAGGTQRLRVAGRGLVGGEHLDDHAIVTLVLIERLDDPVAPVPDVGLALADLGAIAVPVAVPPDVHPVSPPALTVPGAGQQTIDSPLVSVGAGV